MAQLAHRIVPLVIAFAVLSVFYAIVALFWPSVRGQRILRKGFWTDCIYWL